MTKITLAKTLCKAYHCGQVDLGSEDYYLHPFAVAKLCKHRKAKIVAYLHDLIEDTPCTYEVLKKVGFSQEIIDAVVAITHIKTMPYPEYIEIVKKNKLATEAKIADMVHNSDLSRIPNPTEEDYARCKRYAEYIRTLKEKRIANE